MIVIPSLIIFLGMFITMFASFIFITEKNLVPAWSLPIIFFVGFLPIFILLWLLWSIRITDWKLWAFENVRNVHELERRAIQEKLIYKSDSILNKTEIWTKNKKARWNLLKEKFKQEDIFIDDLTIPSETIIYYSKSKSRLQIIFAAFFCLIGIVIGVIANSYFTACIVGIFLIFAAYFIYKRYLFVTNATPQIILNEKGIETTDISFQSWSIVKNEEVITELNYDEASRNYLIFEYPAGQAKIRIDYFDINKPALNKLLRIYRSRNKKERPCF